MLYVPIAMTALLVLRWLSQTTGSQLYLAYRKLGQTELAQKALARSQELRRSSLERDQALILGSPQVDSDPQ